MSCVWVICGAGRGVGKTTLARKLCELLPNSVYAKCGHGAPKAGKPENFFATIAELDAFAHKSARTAEHVVIESNSYARTVQGGIVVFIDSMPNQTRQRKDAGSLREAAQVIVSAGSSRTSYNDALENALPDEQLRGAACELFARQQNYLAGNHAAVRTKVWLETAGERVFGNGLAKLLESVELRGTLGGAEGVKLLPAEDIFSYEEILEVARAAVEMGVVKVRLTGGEPLVRKNIVELVRALAAIDGIRDLAMTTNATLLAGKARALAAAGLDRVNISLDTMDAERYRELTRGGNIHDALDGIDAALAAGLHPVKINCVVSDPSDTSDAESVKEFGRERGLEVRTIRRMDFRTGSFSVVENGTGGDCPHCNRLRLSSNGRIRPCLFSDMQFCVRELGAAEALRQAVAAKPQAGGPCTHDWMSGIGG